MSLYGLGQNRWSIFSGTFQFDDTKMHGLHSMDITEEVQRQKVRGNTQKAAGTTRGAHDASCSAEILLVEWNQLIRGLGPGFGEVPFDIHTTYIEQNGDGLMNIDLFDVKIGKHAKKVSSDGKEVVMAVEFTVIEPVRWNGLTIIEEEDAFWEASGLVIFG